MNEKEWYRLVADELEKGTVDKGIWAKAFSDADGLDSLARARYIKYRIEFLSGSNFEATAPQNDAASDFGTSSKSPNVNENAKRAKNISSSIIQVNTVDFGVLYRAAVGDVNVDYYLKIFNEMDECAAGYSANWNWCAFLFTIPWLLYRKIYGWFFCSVVIFLPLTMIAELGNKSGSAVAVFVYLFELCLFVVFGFFANSIYHQHVLKRIALLRNTSFDDGDIVPLLMQKGGVNIWVKHVLIALMVISLVFGTMFALIGGKQSPKKTIVDVQPTQIHQNINTDDESREWVFLSNNQNGGKIYYDKKSILVTGDVIKFDYLYDYEIQGQAGILSVVVKYRVDCGNKNWRAQKIEAFNRAMGSGEIVNTSFPADRGEVTPGTEFDFLCSGQ